jgi:hypothetical protein
VTGIAIILRLMQKLTRSTDFDLPVFNKSAATGKRIFPVSEMTIVILTIRYYSLVLVELAHKRLALLYAAAMGVKAEAVILSSAFGEVLPRLAREIEATTIILDRSTGGSSRYEGAELERFLDAPKEE